MAKPQTELERFLEDLINKNKGIHIFIEKKRNSRGYRIEQQRGPCQNIC